MPTTNEGMDMPAAAGLTATRQWIKPAAAVLLVLSGAVGIHISSSIAFGLFASLGALHVSGLRMALAAVVLLLLARPGLAGRTAREWASIVVFGLCMAAMNVFLYQALEHIALGVAATLAFLGPFVVALAGLRRVRDGLWAALALIGVALIGGPGSALNLPGVVFALASALAVGGYTVFAGKVGRSAPGLQGLALSVAVAAVCLLPFSLQRAAAVTPPEWGLLAASALVGVVLTYTADFLAIRLSSVRTVSVLFSIDPAAGALIGALLLGQALAGSTLAGIGLIVVAGAAVIWRAGKTAPAQLPAVGLRE